MVKLPFSDMEYLRIQKIKNQNFILKIKIKDFKAVLSIETKSAV